MRSLWAAHSGKENIDKIKYSPISGEVNQTALFKSFLKLKNQQEKSILKSLMSPKQSPDVPNSYEIHKCEDKLEHRWYDLLATEIVYSIDNLIFFIYWDYLSPMRI